MWVGYPELSDVDFQGRTDGIEKYLCGCRERPQTFVYVSQLLLEVIQSHRCFLLGMWKLRNIAIL